MNIYKSLATSRRFAGETTPMQHACLASLKECITKWRWQGAIKNTSQLIKLLLEDQIRIFSGAVLKLFKCKCPSKHFQWADIKKLVQRSLRKLVLEAIRLCWTGQFSRMVSETVSYTLKRKTKDNFKPLWASIHNRKVKMADTGSLTGLETLTGSECSWILGSSSMRGTSSGYLTR